jgi:hypothetical protein
VEREGTLPSSFCEASMRLIPKSDKDTTTTTRTKQNCRPITLKNMGEKKSSIKNSRAYPKDNTSCQVGFILGMQGWFNIHKSLNVIHHINRSKDKIHLIISIDAKKIFNKIQHPFIIKSLMKLGIEQCISTQ